MKPFSRKGLHRLECQMCDGFTYATVPTLERRGLPPCWCGETLQPATIELALAIGAEDAPVMAEYRAKVNSAAHGQVAHVAKGREVESPEFRALFGSKDEPGLIERQREDSRARQIAALGFYEVKVKGSRKGERVRFRLNSEPIPF